MKYNIAIIAFLAGLIGLLYAYKKGVFETQKDEYATLKLPETIDYNFDIKPILSDNCYTCHGPDPNKRKAGLRLDLEETAFAELSESPGKFAIVPKNLRESKAYQAIVSEDPDQMMPPPDSKLALNPYEKKLIKKWIQQGAKFEKHWAFIPPKKSKAPKTSVSETTTGGLGANEIDGFVLEKLLEKGLSPSPRADRATLVRRLSLDLTGLPPIGDQLSEFTTEDSSEDLEQIVDVLLTSPAYGERMAQTWLDVARYADSHGYQEDSYRTMWPWRDWVIHAFNKNMPYDQFITWQLAGDLLPDATLEQQLATGFNRNHPITQEGGVVDEEYRFQYVMDRTNTFGKGIIGVTLECAMCHDHKYDSFSQKEYFSLFAFFNQVDEKGWRMSAGGAAKNNYFADAPFIKITDKETEGVLSFINKEKKTTVDVMVMNDSAPKTTYVHDRGAYDSPTDSVGFGTPSAIMVFSEDLDEDRLGLAKWVTNKNNPLTARVFVNRIWAMIFGRGIVATPGDFGVQGSLPTHPELLDWLAVDFMEHGWDIKYLLKKIVLSDTYAQISDFNEDVIQRDSENLYLARAPRFRMDGELIRDYILATSGLLNREIGGPSVKPYQPPGLWAETSAGGNRGILTKYIQDEGDNLYRRSMYTFWKRTLPPPSMAIFDAPNRDLSEVERQKTNTPLQALALQNDVQVLEAARVLAQKTLHANPDGQHLVAEVFQRILVRKPRDEELKMLDRYYHELLDNYTNDLENAEKLLALGAFEASDTDVASTAALMLTAQVIYNLDETITKE